MARSSEWCCSRFLISTSSTKRRTSVDRRAARAACLLLDESVDDRRTHVQPGRWSLHVCRLRCGRKYRCNICICLFISGTKHCEPQQTICGPAAGVGRLGCVCVFVSCVMHRIRLLGQVVTDGAVFSKTVVGVVQRAQKHKHREMVLMKSQNCR